VRFQHFMCASAANVASFCNFFQVFGIQPLGYKHRKSAPRKQRSIEQGLELNSEDERCERCVQKRGFLTGPSPGEE
jgi:hypothetical protein